MTAASLRLLAVLAHPDHIAISQLTTTAVMAANDACNLTGMQLPHQVQKLYYVVFRAQENAICQEAFGDLAMQVDGVERRLVSWPDWAITTHLDTSDYWLQIWQAVTCHRTQLPGIDALARLPEASHRALWGNQTYYRALSFVNGGRTAEDDLFAGLRATGERTEGGRAGDLSLYGGTRCWLKRGVAPAGTIRTCAGATPPGTSSAGPPMSATRPGCHDRGSPRRLLTCAPAPN